MRSKFFLSAVALLIAVSALGSVAEKGQFDLYRNGVYKGRERYKVEIKKKKDLKIISSEVLYKYPLQQAKRGYVDLSLYPDYRTNLQTGRLEVYKYRLSVNDFTDINIAQAQNSATEVIDQDWRMYNPMIADQQRTEDNMKDRINLGVNSGYLMRDGKALHFSQTRFSATRRMDADVPKNLLVLDPYAFCLYLPLAKRLEKGGPTWHFNIAMPQMMRLQKGKVEYMGVEPASVNGERYLLKHYNIFVGKTLYSSFWTDKTGHVVQISVPPQGVVATLHDYHVKSFSKAAPRIMSTTIAGNQGNFTEKSVQIQSGGITLGATLTLPEGRGPHPAVLLVQDLGETDRDGNYANQQGAGIGTWKQMAYLLSREGLASLRYDARGVGESTGNGAKETLVDRESDIKSLLTWLSHQDNIEKNGIFLMAEGMGCWPAAKASASFSLAGFVGIAYPAKAVLRLWKEQAGMIQDPEAQQRAYAEVDQISSALNQKKNWVEFRKKKFYLESLIQLNSVSPLALLKDIKAPALFAYPQHDKVILPFHREIIESDLGPDQKSILLDGIGHTLTPVSNGHITSAVIDKNSLEPVLRWLKDHEPRETGSKKAATGS